MDAVTGALAARRWARARAFALAVAVLGLAAAASPARAQGPSCGDDTANTTAATAEGDESSDGATAPDEGDEAAPAEAPVDIFAVMQAGGWSPVEDEDLADYLPIPPRAEGQIGHFARDGETVRVARVTYAAAVFADPQEQWIRERMATLPEAHERVVRRGATVVHLRADSDAAADAAAALFEAALSTTGDDGP